MGPRARRGEARYLLLDALKDSPKHGYEIIKALEERSGGEYAPSPGTVYPTLQFLEDAGLVSAEQEGDRRVFRLTEAGQADLDAHAEEVRTFWERRAKPAASARGQAETCFLQEEMAFLGRTIWNGLQPAIDRDDHETVRRVREAVEQCRSEVRRIIAAGEPEASNG